MTDRDKISKGLQCIIDGTVRCESCGYAIDKHGHYSCQQNCASDAIALLKEQEPVEPIIDPKVFQYARCGKCGQLLRWQGNYCHWCGQAVKWE